MDTGWVSGWPSEAPAGRCPDQGEAAPGAAQGPQAHRYTAAQR